MLCPQLVDNQAFIVTKIVLLASRQEVTDNFGKHGSKGFGPVERQSSVGMRPSRRWSDAAAVKYHRDTNTLDTLDYQRMTEATFGVVSAL